MKTWYRLSFGRSTWLAFDISLLVRRHRALSSEWKNVTRIIRFQWKPFANRPKTLPNWTVGFPAAEILISPKRQPKCKFTFRYSRSSADDTQISVQFSRLCLLLLHARESLIAEKCFRNVAVNLIALLGRALLRIILFQAGETDDDDVTMRNCLNGVQD